MLTRLATLVVVRRRLVLVAAVVFVAVAGAVGGGVAGRLTSGGFGDPGAESTRARHAVEDQLDQGDPNVVLLVTAPGGNVDVPAVTAEGTALTAELAAEEGMAEAISYWSLG